MQRSLFRYNELIHPKFQINKIPTKCALARANFAHFARPYLRPRLTWRLETGTKTNCMSTSKQVENTVFFPFSRWECEDNSKSKGLRA